MIKKSLFPVVALLLVSCIWSQESESSTARIVAESQDALEQHNLAHASDLIRAALATHPDNEELLLEQARIYAYQHRDGKALAEISAILRKNPADRQAKLTLAQIYGYSERYQRSDSLYRELLAADPSDEPAAIGLIHNLVLEDRLAEARQEIAKALENNPSSIRLRQYGDLLTATTVGDEDSRPELLHHIQAGETFFADNAGNRSLYSSQGLRYDLRARLSTEIRVEEASLWKSGSPTAAVLSGTDELHFRFNKILALRGSAGGVRFNDESSRGLFAGDVELTPAPGLLLSGGYSSFPILPTFDASRFDLLATGAHGRLDYHSHGLALNGSIYLSRYSDGNHSEREFGEVMKWVGQRKVSLGGGYSARHIHFDQQLNHGYFSPGQYWSHLGIAGARLQLGGAFRGEYLVYLGAEREDPTGYNPAGEAVARNKFFVHHWEVGVNYSHFHLAQATGAFHADMASAEVGYRF